MVDARMLLHAGDKFLIAQIYLLLEMVAPKLTVLALRHESRVFFGSIRCTLSGRKLRVDWLGIQPIGPGRKACERAIAAPYIRIGALDHARAYRVKIDVSAHFQQVAITIHQYRLEAALKQMPAEKMAAVETLGVYAIDLPHQTRQIRLSGMKH